MKKVDNIINFSDIKIENDLKEIVKILNRDNAQNIDFALAINEAIFLYTKNAIADVDDFDKKLDIINKIISFVEAKEQMALLYDKKVVYRDYFEEIQLRLHLHLYLINCKESIYSYPEDKDLMEPKIVPYPMSRLYMLKASILKGNKNYIEAKEYYEKAISWNEYSVLIWQQYAELCIILKDYDLLKKALDKFYRTICGDAWIPVYYNMLGLYYQEKGMKDKALASYTIAKRISDIPLSDETEKYLINEFGKEWDKKIKDTSHEIAEKYFDKEFVYFPVYDIMWHEADQLMEEGKYREALGLYEYIDPIISSFSVESKIKTCRDKLREKYA